MKTVKETIESYYYIRPKQGELQLLHFNEAQNQFYEVFRKAYNSDKPVRIIVLKARQLGISTVTEAIMTELVTTHYNKNALIVAHDSDSSNNIYNMTKLYYEMLPNAIKPMVKYSNAKLLTFENPTQDQAEKEKNAGFRSSIRVSTAGSSGIARGSTFNYVHLSELAFWDSKALDELTGIFQSVPSSPRTMVVIESTANGFNHFKTLWEDAVQGRSDYIPVFIPWFSIQEYAMEYDGAALTEEEERLKELYSLSNEQIQWRRYKIRNDCHGSIEAFRQEYPATPEEAFMLTGNPIFQTEIVLDALKSVFKPVQRGMFKIGYGNEAIQNYALEPQEDGYITIYEQPKPNIPYVMGCDTSGEGSDYFVAYVIDNTTGRIVAKYRNQTDEPLFTRQIYCLGKYYNDALIAIEANFSTYPIRELTRLGYNNQYVRESSLDSYTDRFSERFGFKTTSLTRPVIIANLQDIARDSIECIKDEDLLKEMLSFIKNSNGRAEAAQGQHDDCVMACAITYYCRSQAPMVVEVKDDDIDEEEVSYQDFMEYGG